MADASKKLIQMECSDVNRAATCTLATKQRRGVGREKAKPRWLDDGALSAHDTSWPGTETLRAGRCKHPGCVSDARLSAAPCGAASSQCCRSRGPSTTKS